MPSFCTPASPVSENLRRLMARQGLTIREVVQRSTLDERTVKAILAGGDTRPHARTLHRLARGLEVSVDEFFHNASSLAARSEFDRRSNPAVTALIDTHPQFFQGWTSADFDELYSRFGVGGELTPEGAAAAVEAMNRKREIQEKVAVVLESDQADVLRGVVELLYDKVVVHE